MLSLPALLPSPAWGCGSGPAVPGLYSPLSCLSHPAPGFINKPCFRVFSQSTWEHTKGQSLGQGQGRGNPVFPYNSPTAELLWNLWESPGNLPSLPLSFPSCTSCLQLPWPPLPSPKKPDCQSKGIHPGPWRSRIPEVPSQRSSTTMPTGPGARGWGPRSHRCPPAHGRTWAQQLLSSILHLCTTTTGLPGLLMESQHPRLVWVGEAHLVPRAGTPSLPCQWLWQVAPDPGAAREAQP